MKYSPNVRRQGYYFAVKYSGGYLGVNIEGQMALVLKADRRRFVTRLGAMTSSSAASYDDPKIVKVTLRKKRNRRERALESLRAALLVANYYTGAQAAICHIQHAIELLERSK